MNERLSDTTSCTWPSRRQMLQLLGAGLAGAALPTHALAQGAYPAGTVKLVVPGPAGSSLDNVTRALAEALAERWNHTPVIIDNRPGATTTLGAALVAKSPPDGQTLLVTATTFAQAPHLYRSLPYHPLDSFTPVIQLADSNLWLAINTDVPARTLAEFIALARKSPGTYAYASTGPGATPHLYGHELGKRAGVELLHVPYKGIPPALIDVAGGRVAAMFAPLSDLLPHVQTQRLRILAVTGSARSPLTPDVPTMKESGFDGFETAGFLGILAPAHTPQPIVAQISKAVSAAMSNPKLRANFNAQGYEPVNSSPAAFKSLLQTQLEIWRRAIAAAGVKLE